MARLCPHCENRAAFTQPASVRGNWGKPPKASVVFANTEACAECGGLIIVLRRHTNTSNWEEFAVFPATVPSVNSYVPKNVADDYISGVNCMGINENKAAAAMFRRSLQQIMIDKQAGGGDKLYKQIDDLATKGIITNEIKDWAHEIRYWGNDGAHPASDYLDEISPHEITEVKDFLERVFDYVYVMPGKLDASRINRNAKKNTPP